MNNNDLTISRYDCVAVKSITGEMFSNFLKAPFGGFGPKYTNERLGAPIPEVKIIAAFGSLWLFSTKSASASKRASLSFVAYVRTPPQTFPIG
jgi:hypothetical protein